MADPRSAAEGGAEALRLGEIKYALQRWIPPCGQSRLRERYPDLHVALRDCGPLAGGLGAFLKC